jgi:hypothetical protein
MLLKQRANKSMMCLLCCAAQAELPKPPLPGAGCSGQHGATLSSSSSCWAGIYHDYTSQASLWLSADGSVSASGQRTEQALWWYKSSSSGTLRVLDETGAVWGQLDGLTDGSGASTSVRTFSAAGAVRLVQDPGGFVFPDSAYELWRGGSAGSSAAGGGWVRVQLGRDCRYKQ